MFTTTNLLIGGALVLVAAIVIYLVIRARPAKEEAFHHFRCPGCKRRIRYRTRQVGHKGNCSNCGRDLVFPPVALSTE